MKAKADVDGALPEDRPMTTPVVADKAYAAAEARTAMLKGVRTRQLRTRSCPWRPEKRFFNHSLHGGNEGTMGGGSLVLTAR